MGGSSGARPHEPSALALIGTAAGVLALAYANLVFTRDVGRIAAIWPANAVVVAILLRTAAPYRWRFVTAGVLGILGAKLVFGDPVANALELAACNGLEIALCVELLQRTTGRRIDLSRQSHLIWFLLVAGLVAPLASATIAALALALGQGAPFLRTLAAWYARDALGLLIVTPALLALTYRDMAAAARRLAGGRGLMSLGVLGLSLAAVLGQSRYPFFFLVPPALIFVAFELGLAGTAAGLLATSVAVVILTLIGHGPAALIHGGLAERLGVLQVFLATMTVAVLPVAAALAKRDRLQEELRVSLGEMDAARRLIEESEARFRLLTDSATDVVLKVDLNDTIQYVSPSTRRYGYEPADLVGKSGFSLVHPEDLPKLQALIAELFSGAEPDATRDRTYRVRIADGGYVWMEGNPAIVRDEAGAPLAVISQLRDISERRAAHAALAESEQRHRLIAESATDIISRMGIDGRVTYFSPSVTDVTGYAAAEVTGASMIPLLHPDDVAPTLSAYRQLIAGTPLDEPLAYRIRHRDGHWIWLEGSPALILDAEGAPFEIIDVRRDVTSKVRLATELRAAKEAAEAAAAVKSTFMANMSHEIRTPLTSIIGFTGLLSQHAMLDETAQGYVDRVAGAGQALLSIVNDILDFSKLEAGQVEISPRATAPADLVRDALLMFTPQAHAKGLALECDIADNLPPCLLIDPDRVRQVLLNLIGNAVKFTQVGLVRVSASYDVGAGQLEVRIVDTGAGLTRSQQRKLFHRFSQVDASSTRQHGGTGLGLAISRGLAEAMGGAVGVRSKRGEGSTFYLQVIAPAAEFDIVETSQADFSSIEGLRLLVADDNPANRELVKAILAPFGVAITEAVDGRGALDAAAREPVDVILMDIRMPGLDGLAAANGIRGGDGPNQDVSILAFSADADLARFETAGSAFDGVVRKPIAAEQLIAALSHAMHPHVDLTAPIETNHAAAF